MNTVTLRRFQAGDEFAVSAVICTTLAISNRKDYPPAFIEENIRSHSPAVIAERVKDAHFYVALDGQKVIGCGGITGYWGSTEESYLTSIFVLPDYQGKGVGRRLVEALEADDYFRRAWRIEVGLAKPQYIPRILSSFQSADLAQYKDSMRPLIEKDMAETERLVSASGLPAST